MQVLYQLSYGPMKGVMPFLEHPLIGILHLNHLIHDAKQLIIFPESQPDPPLIQLVDRKG